MAASPTPLNRLARLLALVLAVAVAGRAAEEEPPRTINRMQLYQLDRTDEATLAPDGRHLAYTWREGTRISLQIADVDHPATRATIAVGADMSKSFISGRAAERAQVTYLQWATPGLLVYFLHIPGDDRAHREELRSVHADGTGDRKLLDLDDMEDVFQTAPVMPPGVSDARSGAPPPDIIYPPPVVVRRNFRVIGPGPDGPEALFVEALGGTAVQTELFKVNVVTGKYSSLTNELHAGHMLYDQNGIARMLVTARIIKPTGLELDAARYSGIPDPLPPPYVARQEFYLMPAPGLVKGRQRLSAWLPETKAQGFYEDDENYFAIRSLPLGFGPDPAVLYFASNAGRDTWGIYALDFRTKQRTDFQVEVPGFDLAGPDDEFAAGRLVLDRHTRKLLGIRPPWPAPPQWLDADLAAEQHRLDAEFPGRHVQLVDWDDRRERMLVLVTGPDDPGRYYICKPGPTGRTTEILRRAPWLTADQIEPASTFAFAGPGGRTITGTLTRPRWARLAPAPLVLYCHDLPGRPEGADFNRDTQALAGMGFLVAEVNFRGTTGLGTAYRDAAKAGFDRVPLEDLQATIDWLVAQHLATGKRTAIVGHDFGGYLALRALQLFPGKFRCAVSIDGPANLADFVRSPAWLPGGGGADNLDPGFARRRTFFGDDFAKLSAISVTPHADALNEPVFLIQDMDKRDLWPTQAKDLRSALRRLDRAPAYLETNDSFTRGEAVSRAQVMGRIEEFLVANIYSFGVDIGEAKEAK